MFDFPFRWASFLVADRMFIWPEAIHDLLKHKIESREQRYTYYLKSIEYIKWSIKAFLILSIFHFNFILLILDRFDFLGMASRNICNILHSIFSTNCKNYTLLLNFCTMSNMKFIYFCIERLVLPHLLALYLPFYIWYFLNI